MDKTEILAAVNAALEAGDLERARALTREAEQTHGDTVLWSCAASKQCHLKHQSGGSRRCEWCGEGWQ